MCDYLSPEIFLLINYVEAFTPRHIYGHTFTYIIFKKKILENNIYFSHLPTFKLLSASFDK